MKMWNDFITREDLLTETGEVDQDKVKALSINLYLAYLEGCVELTGYEFPDLAWEKVDDIMLQDYCCRTRVLEGRKPDIEEISAYLDDPENIRVKQNWTYIFTHANADNLADIIRRIREEGNIPEDVPLKNEDRINAQLEKLEKERTWTVKRIL